MARVFVATAGPPGMALGRWRELATPDHWQEEREDGSSAVFEAQPPSETPGSSTIRLRAVEEDMEVLLLDTSAQLFAAGRYFGEFLGHWEACGATLRLDGAYRPTASMKASPSCSPYGTEMLPLQFEFGTPLTLTGFTEKAVPAASPPLGGSLPPPPSAVSAAAGASPALAQRKGVTLDSSPQTGQRLCTVCKVGDLRQVQQLLAAAADPDGSPGVGSPLLVAAEGGYLPVVEALLAAGADPNRSSDGGSPMTAAFKQGHQEVLRALFGAAYHALGHQTARSKRHGDESSVVDAREGLLEAAADPRSPPRRPAAAAAEPPLDPRVLEMRERAVKEAFKAMVDRKGH